MIKVMATDDSGTAVRNNAWIMQHVSLFRRMLYKVSACSAQIDIAEKCNAGAVKLCLCIVLGCALNGKCVGL